MLTAYRQLLQSAAGRRLIARIGYPLVMLLAVILRFFNLANPHALVFDETYYVKDAYTLSQTGVEMGWPVDPDKAFVAGNVHSFTNYAAFVVHPPLGKWLIALGMNLFGATSSFGWRFSAAVFGTLLVALTMVVARHLMKSVTWSLLAGFFMAIDGHAIVLSRTALLDGFLAVFALLAFWFVLLDRDQSRRRLLSATYVRLTWVRPWLMAAAVALGCATAVKWSGLWFALGFGLYASVSEGLFRRRLTLARDQAADAEPGETFSLTLRQTLVNATMMAPIYVAVYIASWTGWLIGDNGYDGRWGNIKTNLNHGFFAWVPAKLQALWHYHQEAYNFHVNLHAPHSYASNPLTWLLLARPTSFYYEGNAQGQNGCTFATGCSAAVTALGNPLIWYGALAALIWLTYRFIRHRESAPGLILLGIACGYLPWLAYMGRTVFQFYAIAFLPWLILALVYALRHWLHKQPADARGRAEIMLTVYLGLVVAVSAYFYPIWTGMNVPYLFWYYHMWIPSWI